MDKDADVFEDAFHALGVGDEVGGEVAAVKLHAFDYFEGGLHRLGFLDGNDPSFPTFFMASAMMPPICLSLGWRNGATWAIMSPLTSLWSFWISATATSTAFSMPRLRAVGLGAGGDSL